MFALLGLLKQLGVHLLFTHFLLAIRPLEQGVLPDALDEVLVGIHLGDVVEADDGLNACKLE